MTNDFHPRPHASPSRASLYRLAKHAVSAQEPEDGPGPKMILTDADFVDVKLTQVLTMT